MATHDLVIRNALVATTSGVSPGDVVVDGSAISAVVPAGTAPSGAREIDAGGRHVIPGLVDTHTHHRDPGFTHKEDATTVTAAAAAGGVTTTFAMPNVSPPPRDPESLAAMIEHYRTATIVDWNINAAATKPEAIPELATMGIAAFKVFMVADTGRDYPHMPGLGVHHHGELLDIFGHVAKTGLPLMVHPHDQQLMDSIEHSYWERGERDFRAYARAYADHDGIIWDTALALILRIQRAMGTRLHVLHVHTRGMVELLAAAKAAGQAVSSEVNPWALFLGNDWETIERLGSYALSFWVPDDAPLWSAMRDGTIDVVATDHAPHLPEEKEPGWTDGWAAHTGTPSIDFYAALLLDAVGQGRLTIEDFVRLTATRPAQLFGLNQKGAIEPGRDADLVVVDTERTYEITRDMVFSKCGWSPYEGRTVTGGIDVTLVRGEVVFENGEITGTPGHGIMAKPGV